MPISKGPVLLFGLKVLSPAPDQLPGKWSTTQANRLHRRYVPPTVQAIVESVEFASPLQSRIPTNRIDSLCVKDFSLSEQADWG